MNGYKMGEQLIKIICDADDVIIIAKDEDNL